MTGQEKVSFKYRRLLNRGDIMGRFYCIYTSMQYICVYTITNNQIPESTITVIWTYLG